MALSLIKSFLSPVARQRLRSLCYAPWVLRDIVLCGYWGMTRPPGLCLLGLPLIQQSRRGAIQFGENFKAVSLARHNSIGVLQRVTIKALGPEGVVYIGNNVGVSGATISARSSITIGDNVLIGSGVLISDNDAHPLLASERNDFSRRQSAPVIIEDDVFVGARAIILKGVSLGRGAVVGAGSVVSRDVPPNTVVAGNPAKVVKVLDQD